MFCFFAGHKWWNRENIRTTSSCFIAHRELECQHAASVFSFSFVALITLTFSSAAYCFTSRVINIFIEDLKCRLIRLDFKRKTAFSKVLVMISFYKVSLTLLKKIYHNGRKTKKNSQHLKLFSFQLIYYLPIMFFLSKFVLRVHFFFHLKFYRRTLS